MNILNSISDTSKNVIIPTVSKTVTNFYDFLIAYDIIGIGIAFIIGTQINKLGSDFIDNIISPIILRFF